MKEDKLGQPIVLPCGAILQNRLAKAAMTERLARGDHNPNELHIALYRQWGLSRVGLLLTGNIMVDRQYLESAGNVCVEDERAIQTLKRWAEEAQKNGSALWGQVGSAGRQTSRLVNFRPISASNIQLRDKGFYGRPHAATESKIREMIERFARTAYILKSAGFGGVQVHAAHGYLISQFLSPVTNHRLDSWGGSLENRARMLLETVRAIRKAVGPRYPVSVKLNSSDFQKGGFDELESLTVVRWLAGEKIDLLEISGGNYENPSFFRGGGIIDTTSKSTVVREAYFLDFAERVRSATSIPLMITGGFRSRQFVEDVLASGKADLIGMGRPFLCDTDFGFKFLTGKLERVELPHLKAGRAFGLMAEGGFYDYQICALAKGRKPKLNLSPIRAVFRILWGEIRKSIAHRLYCRAKSQ